jgi:hypothetical protein
MTMFRVSKVVAPRGARKMDSAGQDRWRGVPRQRRLRTMRSMTFVLVLLAAAACGGKAKGGGAQPAPVAQPAPSNRVVEEPPPAPPQEVAVAESETGVPECDAYLALFDRLLVECQKELGPALDAMKQSQDAMREAFSQLKTLDEESRRAATEAAATGCSAAVDALRQSATSMNCLID